LAPTERRCGGLERYADAEAAFLEAHEFLEAALGPEHQRTIKVIRSLVDLYESWGAAEPGKGCAEKAAEWRKKIPKEPAVRTIPRLNRAGAV
jgi:hypothetical protein